MAQIVSSHVSHNAVRADALPALIQSVYATLATVGQEAAPVEKQQPAVPVKRSVFPDYIVCLEDGKKLKMLKRHLQTSYGLTPDQYRERWGLPPDYPMVAPNYAERRSDLAKKIGLGRKRAAPDMEMETEFEAEAPAAGFEEPEEMIAAMAAEAEGAPVVAAPARRGRKPKSAS